jgi:CelD/BcsL family acetyltransferase involved in cellulose biosynthesis
MATVRWIEGSDVFAEPGAWRELTENAANATPFQTFEWQKCWLEELAGRGKPRALAVYEGSDLIAWWPLYERMHLGWSVFRPMGMGPSDYLHPLVRCGYESVAAQLAEALDSQSTTSLVDLHQLRGEFAPGLMEALAPYGAVRQQATCLVRELGTSYVEFVASLSKSLRYDVKRLDKAPFSTGEAKIELATADTVEASMEAFFNLHAKRWRRRWQPGAFPARIQRFHRSWGGAAVGNGWLRLYVCVKDGNPIGALYGISLGKTTYYYQAGMDPEHRSLSPGTLLVANAIRDAIEAGHERFDFLRGDEPYKRRWKPELEHGNFRFTGYARGIRGATGAKWQGVAGSIEDRIRARLEGRSLVS